MLDSKDPKDLGYKTICISLYDADLAQLDNLIARLKQSGLRKANRSAIIRYALKQLSEDDIPTDPNTLLPY